MTTVRPMIGYHRDGAELAHLVGSVTLRQAVCGVALESIPSDQTAAARFCLFRRSDPTPLPYDYDPSKDTE